MLLPHDLGRSQVNSQQTHEIVYSVAGGPIKIVNPPPHLPHPVAAAAEMTAGGTPVVSAIADGRSVEIKPYPTKKKKSSSEVVIQQPPPTLQQQQPLHSIEMQPPKSLPTNNSQQQHLQHNLAAAGIVMSESVHLPYAVTERYRTISEKSIAESTLSTDAEPFVYTGPSSNSGPQSAISTRVEEITHPVSTPEMIVPFVPATATTSTVGILAEKQQHLQETVSLKPEVEVEPPTVTKGSNNTLETLVASVEKLSVEDNNNSSTSSNQAGGHSSSSNKKNKNKKRAEEMVASETSISNTNNNNNTSSSKAPATVITVEQPPQLQLQQQPMVPAAVDETDRSVVSTEAPGQQQSSSSLISNLVEHNTSKLDNDNIINNNNVECTSTKITTTDNTTDNNNASSPMENAKQQSPDSRQQQQHTTATTLDVENNLPPQQHQPEFDDNKNVVATSVESAPPAKQISPEPAPVADPAIVAPVVTQKDSTAAAPANINKLAAAPPALPAKKSRSITSIEYDPDQWSPDNPTGKRKYSRDQLLQLKNTVQAREKPTNLPNSLEYVLVKSNHGGNSSAGGGNQYGKNNFTNEMSLLPTFIKDRMVSGGGGGGNMGQMRQPYPAKRSSQQGNSGQSNKQSQQGMSKTGSKIIRLQLDEEVKLNECANAWRPRYLQANENVDDVERVTQELFKKFRSVLNKLTPDNFDKLVQQVKGFVIDTDERLDGCIKLVFEKAISEPNFSEAYAKMCKEIGTIAVLSNEKRANFKSRLLSQCQTEFERRRNDQTSAIRDGRAKLAASKGMGKEELEELKASLEEEEQKVRRRAVGTVRFIGELFKHGQLTANIMHNCIQLLLTEDKEYDEETLECLCKLLTTIGFKMEKENDQDLSKYFDKMQDIVKHRDQYRVSSRIRFMIQDVIELRRNVWQPRRTDQNPKTMIQIVKETESEQFQINMNYLPRSKDSSYSGDMGRGNRNMQGGSKMGGPMTSGYNQGSLGRGGNQSSMKGGRPQTDDDGFQQISNNRNNRSLQIDPKKINIPGSVDLTSKLGSAALYQSWKNHSNMYAALNNEDAMQGGNMMDHDIDRNRDRSGSQRDRDRDRDRNQRDRDRDRDRDRSGSHNKNSGGKDSYHHNKGSMERDRYNRYGSSSSQNDDRMSRSSREPSSGGMRPMGGQHSNSQMHDRDRDRDRRDRDRDMGNKIPSQQPMPSRSSQQRHIPQSVAPSSSSSSSSSGRMGGPSGSSNTLSKSGSGQLYQQQQQLPPQFVIPKDTVRRTFPPPDAETEKLLQKFSKAVNIEMDELDIKASIDMLKGIKSEFYHAAVSQLLADNIERDEKTREIVVRVIAQMFQDKIIGKADYLHALEQMFIEAEDLIIDIPRLFKYIAKFYVLLLHQRYINLADIRNVAQEIIEEYGHSILKHLLLQYEASYGKDATVMLWYESSLNFSDFIKLGSNEKVEKYLNDAKLGYLLVSGSKSLDMQTIGAQIKQFLKCNAIFVGIFKWISDYVGPERETSNEFIRTLTKTVIEHCIDNKTKLNHGLLQKWHQILQKYIDNKPERELQAMYAIQRLVVELEHPQNLLHSILENLYEYDVIMAGFTLWKDSTDPLEAEGKGVCLKGITQFLTMVLENSTDEDN